MLAVLRGGRVAWERATPEDPVTDLPDPVVRLVEQAIVRSPYAHARIVSVDASRALAMPGVICVLTGADVKQQTDPFEQSIRDPFDQLRDYCMLLFEV